MVHVTRDKSQERIIKKDDNFMVALRIRPLSEDEIIQKATPIAYRVDEQMVVLLDPMEDKDDVLRVNRSREKQFVFDHTFDGSATQQETYDKAASFLMASVVDGYNATVFAYGATGTGKTHTMLGTDEEPGIMVCALNDLFQEMKRTQEHRVYKVTMSYLEIYNEMIRDLLNPGVGYLELREDSKGIQVAGLSNINASSTREVMDILVQGNKQRTQEPTAANKASSRSHAVLQITVRQRSRVVGVTREVKTGKLFLVDLAGSERAANTHNRGKRMVEGAHINRSLLALGNCINALSEKTAPRYINYRDSKLTRLLKDALGGNCRTVMIAHISPASFHFEESRNTLVYADRAKNIRTKIKQNVMDVSYHIAQYTNIIAELRTEIQRLHRKLDQRSLTDNRNSSAIQAIQSEVMMVSRHEDDLALGAVKDRLLAFFNAQMDLRRRLIQVNSSSMELQLERSRNDLIVKRWEREKQGHKRWEGDDAGVESALSVGVVNTSMGGAKAVDEPEEVRAARVDLETLSVESASTEKLKLSILQQIDDAKIQVKDIEKMLPKKLGYTGEREVLSLMCRVHELEMDNMNLHSENLVKRLHLRKKDMIADAYQQHLNICDEIIRRQREVIDTSVTPVNQSSELEELYSMYKQGMTFNPSKGDSSLPDINKNRRLLDVEYLTDNNGIPVEGNHPDLHLPLLFTDTTRQYNKNEENIYTRRKTCVGSKNLSNNLVAGVPSNQLVSAVGTTDVTMDTSDVTSSQMSDHELITEKPATHAMVTSTRHIALLAAQRKINREERLSVASMAIGPGQEDSISLTQSRLAQHDNSFVTSIIHNAIPYEDDNMSHNSTATGDGHRNRHRIQGRKISNQPNLMKRKSYPQNTRNSVRQSYNFKEETPAKGARRIPHSLNTFANRVHPVYSTNIYDELTDDFSEEPTVVNRGRNHKKNKVGSKSVTSSNGSTPLQGRKRKTDSISITGFALKH